MITTLLKRHVFKRASTLPYAAAFFGSVFAIVAGCSISNEGIETSAIGAGGTDGGVVVKLDAKMPDPNPDKAAAGETCQGDSACASGICASGVCCDSPCASGCFSCALPGTLGKCSPLPAGMMPMPGTTNTCKAESPNTCGLDGTCNGVGGCRNHVAGTACGQGSCDGNTETPAPVCNGKGACSATADRPCSPYICGERACSTRCRKNDECAKDTLCIDQKCQVADAPYVNYSLSAPSIDGMGDDDVWARLTPQWMTVSNVVAGSVGSPEDLTSRWKGLWTPDAFFILIEVTDSSLRNDNNPPQETHKDDGIEIYFDANNSRNQTYDNVDDVQYVFGWGDDSFIEGKLNKRQGVEWSMKTSGNERSYVLEARFPWTTLGSMTPIPGKRIGFQVAVNDDDDGGERDAQIVWHGRLSDFATRPASLGSLILAGP